VDRNSVQGYIAEIVASLEPLDPAKVILFGSAAHEPPAEVGDLDLLVVTRSNELPQTYREKEAIYLAVAQALRAVRQRVPLDLIVHTQPMHDRFTALDSQFARHVLQEGRVLYESHHP
jgi:predicted nucleotidyltransferase